MLRTLCTAITLSALSACGTSGAPPGIPVQLVQGDQLKLWGVAAYSNAEAVKVEGQVTRTALPRGALRQHVHVEILDAGGVVTTMQDAEIYPVTALRGPGHARISATLAGAAAGKGGAILVRVVEGVPHE